MKRPLPTTHSLARLCFIASLLTSGTALAEGQEHDHETHGVTSSTQSSGGAKVKAPASDMTSGQGMSSGSQEMHQMHMDMMQKMPQMQMSGDTDKDFAMMMKHHHEQGVKMAEIEAKNGKSPEMKAMANKIIQTQKQEIKKLEDWLSKNKK